MVNMPPLPSADVIGLAEPKPTPTRPPGVNPVPVTVTSVPMRPDTGFS